ncbi:MAG: nuclear transport factor 2 family protein [Pseudomonadota bacterium]
MKKWFFVLIMVFFSSISAASDTGTQADHDQLRQLLKTAQEAVNSDRPELLEEYLHKDYIITVMNQEVVTQERPLKQLFHDWFKKPDAILKSLRIDPEATIETRIYGGRFGFCYGTSVDTYALSDGREFAFDSKWTATLIKEDEQWKLLALHVGVDPIENPLIDGYRSGLGFGGVMIEFGRLLFD